MREQRELRRAARAATTTALVYQLCLGSVMLFGDWPGARGSLWDLGPWVLAALFVVPAAMPLAAWAHLRGRGSAWAYALPYALPIAFGVLAGAYEAHDLRENFVDYPWLAEIQTSDLGLTALALGLTGAAFVAGLFAALDRRHPARGYGQALFGGWLLLLAAQAHLFGQSLGLLGCKCGLGFVLVLANQWFGAAHDLAWVGGAALGGVTLAYVACHRRLSWRAVGTVLLIAGSLAGLEDHFAGRVLSHLPSSAVPADVELPRKDAPAFNAIPDDALFVGREGIHHGGQRVGDTAELSTPGGCQRLAARIVPRSADPHSLEVVIDAGLPASTMRCLHSGLIGALPAVPPPSSREPGDPTRNCVVWLYAGPAPHEPLRGVLASVEPAVSGVVLDEGDLASIPSRGTAGEAIRRLR